MADYREKLDQDLLQILQSLDDQEEVTVLVYADNIRENLEAFLARKMQSGDLKYNILRLANAVAVQARKEIIVEIAGRAEVRRIRTSPRFGLH